MAGWNFADIFTVVADEILASPALIQGSRRVTWKELDTRADSIARYLAANGVQHQDKVTQYLHNTPEYLESVIACFRVRCAAQHQLPWSDELVTRGER
jgi:fatty-acyl-CoA synthase